jgi:hypothetical protein
MLKILREKISKFTTLHPQAVIYGISLGVTIGIALAVSFAMNPHDALASVSPNGKGIISTVISTGKH